MTVEKYLGCHVNFRITPRTWVNVHPLHIELSAQHWGARPHTYYGVVHHEAPRDWPWWRLVTLNLCRLSVSAPSTGRRLWIYTRWGSLYAQYFIDRRGEQVTP